LKQVGVGGFAVNKYWSSTEFDNNTAWYQTFTTDDYQGIDKKLFMSFYVRAIRAF
jgi:hypothetical protein